MTNDTILVIYPERKIEQERVGGGEKDGERDRGEKKGKRERCRVEYTVGDGDNGDDGEAKITKKH